jgi:phosphopentomutase
VPVLDSLGLGAAVRFATGVTTPGLNRLQPNWAYGARRPKPVARQGHAVRATGNWRACRCHGTGPISRKRFRPLTTRWSRRSAQLAGTDGILGNCHASGIPIITQTWARNTCAAGWPICYTSADSQCFRLPRMKQAFGLERGCTQLCADLAPHPACPPRRAASSRGPLWAAMQRWGSPARATGAILPSHRLRPRCVIGCKGQGASVHAVGKIGDIFSAGRG